MKVINSQNISPFGGLNFVIEEFDKQGLDKIIEAQLPALGPQTRYNWKDILYSYWSVFLCGGDCAEDLSKNLRPGFSLSPLVRESFRGFLPFLKKYLFLGSMQLEIFQYKDHTSATLSTGLGNIRLSYKNTGTTTNPVLTIVQENNYYPFGLQHKGYNEQVNGEEYPYKTFQGQELNKELGLNWLSFKYRNYDPAIGRFMSIDPLAAKYPYNGVYNFSENRVVDAVELEGLEKIIITDALNKEKYMGNMWKIINNNSKLRNIYYSISRADRMSTQMVIFGILPTDNTNNSNRLGLTLHRMAGAVNAFKKGFHFSNENLYKKIFKLNNLDGNKLIKNYSKGRKIWFVGLDPADVGKNAIKGTKTLMHEINQHLKNDLNGKNISQELEHFMNFSNPNKSWEYNMKHYFKTGSPSLKNIPSQSIQGKINTAIDKSALELLKKSKL